MLSRQAVVIVALFAERTNKKSRLILACVVGGLAALAIAAGLNRASPMIASPNVSQEKTNCEECEDTDHSQAGSVLFRAKVTWEAE